MSLLKTALDGLIAALSAQRVEDAVATLAAAKDKAFADYHDKVKSSYNSLVDAIRSNDILAVSSAAELFEAVIEDGDHTQQAHAEASAAIVAAVLTDPPDAPEELGAANQAFVEDAA